MTCDLAFFGIIVACIVVLVAATLFALAYERPRQLTDICEHRTTLVHSGKTVTPIVSRECRAVAQRMFRRVSWTKTSP